MTQLILILSMLVVTLTGHATGPVQSSTDLYDRLSKDYDPTIRQTIGPPQASSSSCEIRRVTLTGKDPLLQTDRKVELLQYAPKAQLKPVAPGKKPKTLFLLPPTGGINRLDRGYASRFCNDLTARVVILLSWEHSKITVDTKSHDKNIIRALSAMRHTLEYIGEKQVPVFGTSVGALSATLLMGMDDRVSGGVLIVGGIGMGDIIATSTEKTLTRLRRTRMNQLGFTHIDQYRKHMNKEVTIDPGALASRYHNKEVLLVMATKDTTVPSYTQVDLRDSFTSPKVITFNSSHMGAIVRSYYGHADKFSRFLASLL